MIPNFQSNLLGGTQTQTQQVPNSPLNPNNTVNQTVATPTMPVNQPAPQNNQAQLSSMMSQLQQAQTALNNIQQPNQPAQGADISGFGGYQPSQEEQFMQNTAVPFWMQDMQASTDPMAYRQNYINMFQDRINALNQVYDQQLASAQQQGVGRVGQGTAVLARRGLAGSPRGGAIQEGILDQNRQIEGAIQAERSMQIQAIMGEATQLAVQEAREKREAKERSTQSYLEYLRGEDSRTENRAGSLAAMLLNQGIDINDLDPEQINQLAQSYKINPDQMKNAYNSAMQAQLDAEFEREGELLKRGKTAAEIKQIDANIKLARDKFNQDVKEFGMNYAMKQAEAGGASSPAEISKQLTQIDFLKQTVNDAKAIAKASGKSGINRALGDTFVGDTNYRQLETLTDTLKTNLLTLYSDPNIKKFFGPQMSEADVRMMTGSASTLNPRSNNPTYMAQELDRVMDLFNRLEQSLGGAQSQGGSDPLGLLN
jgi:hypothetical protein